MKEWKITYMTDYPYSDSITVEARTESSAWKKFEKKVGFKRNEYCSIKEL
jgi:hypothetical protein